MKKKYLGLSALLVFAVVGVAIAQSTTKSPYDRSKEEIKTILDLQKLPDLLHGQGVAIQGVQKVEGGYEVESGICKTFVGVTYVGVKQDELKLEIGDIVCGP